MTLGDNLKYTLNGIFDLYKIAAKKLYGLSFVYSIVSSIVAAIISLICCFIFFEITDNPPYPSENFLDRFFMDTLTLQRLQDIVKAILILNFGLYGIFLLREESINRKNKYSLKQLIVAISKDDWTRYFVFLVMILLINGLLFKQLFDTSSDNTGFISFLGAYSPFDRKVKFYSWLNSIVELIKVYIPYFLAMLLIMFNYGEKLSIENLKKYKVAFISALILSFCIETLSREVANYVNYYIISLIKIPFINEFFPAVFGFLILIAITAFFYLGFAATIAYPFKYQYEAINWFGKNDETSKLSS